MERGLLARRLGALLVVMAVAAACTVVPDANGWRLEPSAADDVRQAPAPIDVDEPDEVALADDDGDGDPDEDVFALLRRKADEIRAERERRARAEARRASAALTAAEAVAEAERVILWGPDGADALERLADQAEAEAAKRAAEDPEPLAASDPGRGLVVSTQAVDGDARQPDPASPWTLQLTTTVVGDAEPESEPAVEPAAAPTGGLVLTTDVVGADAPPATGGLVLSTDVVEPAAAEPGPPATAVLSAVARRPDEEPAGQLVVGCDLANPPFAALDARGIPVGRDVEMVERLAAGMGLDVLWYRLPFDELLDALEAGTVDAVCATLGVTPERARRVAFTRPYFETEILAVVRAGSDAPRGLDDLAGRRVSAGRGTTSERAVRARVPEAELVLENDKGLAADERLLAGELDAAVMDGPDAHDLVRLSRGRLALIDEALADESYAIALRIRDRAALVAWNKALQAFASSGAADELDARHGLRQR